MIMDNENGNEFEKETQNENENENGNENGKDNDNTAESTALAFKNQKIDVVGIHDEVKIIHCIFNECYYKSCAAGCS